MPLLDVSFMTYDAMLSDVFDVLRRLNTMTQLGRVQAPIDYVAKNVAGVVTQQDPADLIRTEDGQNIPKRIFFATQYQVIAAAEGQQPDVIKWNGVYYTVVSSLPYSRFGDGFYEVIAEFRGTIPPLQ